MQKVYWRYQPRLQYFWNRNDSENLTKWPKSVLILDILGHACVHSAPDKRKIYIAEGTVQPVPYLAPEKEDITAYKDRYDIYHYNDVGH